MSSCLQGKHFSNGAVSLAPCPCLSCLSLKLYWPPRDAGSLSVTVHRSALSVC